MANDPMDLAYAAVDELGADVADIRISGDRDGDLHLPGTEVLLLGGVAVASAFLKGLWSGLLKGSEDLGEAVGKGFVQRFAKLAGSRLPPQPGPVKSAETAGAVHARASATTALAPPSADDVIEEFRSAAADAQLALTRLGVAAGYLRLYAGGAQLEVAATLRGLGLRADRVERIAPLATARLLQQIELDRGQP
jgi:hypothetical protein